MSVTNVSDKLRLAKDIAKEIEEEEYDKKKEVYQEEIASIATEINGNKYARTASFNTLSQITIDALIYFGYTVEVLHNKHSPNKTYIKISW